MKHELTHAQRQLARFRNARKGMQAEVAEEIARGVYKPAPFSRLLLQTEDDVQRDYDDEREHGWGVK